AHERLHSYLTNYRDKLNQKKTNLECEAEKNCQIYHQISFFLKENCISLLHINSTCQRSQVALPVDNDRQQLVCFDGLWGYFCLQLLFSSLTCLVLTKFLKRGPSRSTSHGLQGSH
uniref:Uncharacterized protein n=1 Tax=Oryzias sinensis TaxID=183150 RepID=A0A8C8DD29_9TELE